jgi:hypothetical protein
MLCITNRNERSKSREQRRNPPRKQDGYDAARNADAYGLAFAVVIVIVIVTINDKRSEA